MYQYSLLAILHPIPFRHFLSTRDVSVLQNQDLGVATLICLGWPNIFMLGLVMLSIYALTSIKALLLYWYIMPPELAEEYESRLFRYRIGPALTAIRRFYCDGFRRM